jgi:hypothetical protein
LYSSRGPAGIGMAVGPAGASMVFSVIPASSAFARLLACLRAKNPAHAALPSGYARVSGNPSPARVRSGEVGGGVLAGHGRGSARQRIDRGYSGLTSTIPDSGAEEATRGASQLWPRGQPQCRDGRLRGVGRPAARCGGRRRREEERRGGRQAKRDDRRSRGAAPRWRTPRGAASGVPSTLWRWRSGPERDTREGASGG